MPDKKVDESPETAKIEMMPPHLQGQPGLGYWTKSVNGYRWFLEAAIEHFKRAAALFSEKNMKMEYEVFSKRAQELQAELDNSEHTHESD